MKIPDWFDPKNYDCASTWTSKEWSHAVSTRLLFSNWISSPDQGDEVLSFLGSGYVPRSGRESDAQSLAQQWDNLLMDLHVQPSGLISEAFYSDMKNYTHAAVTTIHPVNLGYVGVLHQELIEPLSVEDQEHLRGITNSGADSGAGKWWPMSVEDRNIDLGFHAEQWGNCVLAQISLDMPDDLLAEQFLEFVHASRKKYGVEGRPRRPTSGDFRRWHEHRVLGYYDLMLWSKIHSAPLTNEQIGTYLFPDEFELALADKIRKVVKPSAEKVFSEATRMALDSAVEPEWFGQKNLPEEKK